MIDEVLSFLAEPDPARFERLALDVFAFQYGGNEPYRRFCDRRGRTPSTVARWVDIPAVPVEAFREVDLAVAGLGEGTVFRTSGTTRGAERRGRHRVPVLEVYRRAALVEFERQVLPDGARPRFLVLAPPLAEAPESSLGQMIEWLAESFSAAPAEWFVRGGRLDEETLAARLRELVPAREPLLLIGVTRAFVPFVEHARRARQTFRLPYGSRLVDTGGAKGLARPLSRKGLLHSFWETLGVSSVFVANEYGMTEMCSQFYDDAIRNHVLGRKRERAKTPPPWVRTTIVSPESLEPVPPGERGLLRHLDLANVGSVLAIQTEDLGVAVGDGFEVLGRLPGAEARGCAMLLEDVR